MKKKLCFLIISVFFTVHCSLSTVFGAFLDAGFGVRPLGMGAAFTSIADDANAPMYNPSGVAQVKKREVAFMSSRLFAGLEGVEIGLNYFAYVQPMKKYGSVAVSWASLYSPSLYREDTGIFTYARSVNDIFGFKSISVSLGFNLKYLRHEYSLSDIRSQSDPVFAAGSAKDGITYDAGILFSIPKAGLSFGYADKNMNRPDVGLKTEDRVDNESAAGISYYTQKLPVLNIPYFTMSFDYVTRPDFKDYRIGLETWLYRGKVPVRAGARNQELTCGAGYEFSLARNSKLSLDYAFAWPLEVEKTVGSHRMGLSLRF